MSLPSGDDLDRDAEEKQATESTALPAKAFYTHTHSQHGIHAEIKPREAYVCPDAQDLEMRVRRAFKELGYEF